MKLHDEVVLGSFGQVNRGYDYRIITKILSRGSDIVVRKEAYTEHAIPHIKKLLINNKLLSKHFSPLAGCRAAKVLAHGKNYVDFEYIEGDNLESLVYESILSRNYQQAVDLIDRLFLVIDGLSSKRGSEERDIVKEINDLYSSDEELSQFIHPGAVDLNLDNFILDEDGDLVAFDYEWLFEEPIASSYIKTRVLLSFFLRRSESFGFLAGEDNNFISISDPVTTALIPEFIFNKYAGLLTRSSVRKYWKAEDIFQNSINPYRKSTAPNTTTLIVSKTNQPNPTYPALVEARNDKLESELIASEKQVRELKSVLRHIQSSKSYKVARKFAGVIKKFS